KDPQPISAMSWSELERLVDEAEADTEIRSALRHCRSRDELVLAARRLGYRVTRIDLVRAWQEHQWQREERSARAR
ncbi:MAG: Nif11 family protein, partial [Cyanobacteriota bacterium]|nr:Nif11 family protein [Cyanobacteriota bacterium]